MSRRAVLLLLLLANPGAAKLATQRPQPFDQAEVFLELNDTSKTLGIQASVDGEKWTDLKVRGPSGVTLFSVLSSGSLRSQGLSELSWQSTTPAFEELSPADLLRRFPEGRYHITGRTPEGRGIDSVAVLSHVLADRPRNILVSGAPAAESCDATPLPVVSAPVTIHWDPVTQPHPDLGKRGPVSVRQYQLFVEGEAVALSLYLPPSVTEFPVPAAITALAKELKFQIIVRTSDGNNTAVESCFLVR